MPLRSGLAHPRRATGTRTGRTQRGTQRPATPCFFGWWWIRSQKTLAADRTQPDFKG